MKSIIKKGLILLFLNLYLPIPLLSQNISDSILIKTTAIIFAEHEKLSIENPLLKKQIKSLEELNKLYETSDSLYKEEINTYKEKSKLDNLKIKKLESSKKKTIFTASLGGIALFIIGLIL